MISVREGIARLRRVAVAPIVFLGAMTLWHGSATAAPGDLDRSFGGTGVVRPAGEALEIAVGPENGVFAVERKSCGVSDCMSLTVARYTPDGSLDGSFGAASAPIILPAGLSSGSSFAVDPSGRPVVVARSREGILVQRFQANGAPDPAFGPGGTVVAAQLARPETTRVLVGSDGAIIAAGVWLGPPAPGAQAAPDAYSTELMLARFLPNGGLDPGFGKGGVARLTVSPTAEYGQAAALMPDGSTMLATGSYPTGPRISRITSNGSLDQGFSPSFGEVFSHLRHQPDVGTSLAMAMVPRRQGALDVLGSAGALGRGYVVRLRADGSPNRKFGRKGVRLLPIPVEAATGDAGGRVVGLGYSFELESSIAFRMRPGGSIDRTFAGGAAPIETNERYLDGGSLGIGPNGSPVVLDPGSPICPRGSCGPAEPRIFRFIGRASRARCLGHRATVVGTRSKDVLRGTHHRDVIAALGGGDEVHALGGNDLICGGPGADLLFGGPGKDRVRR